MTTLQTTTLQTTTLQTTTFNTQNTQVHLSTTDKFATVSICLLFRTPLQRETATAQALIPRILTMGCAKHKTMRQLNAYLDTLGSAVLIAEPVKKGDEQIISFYITAPKEYTGRLFELLSDIVYNPLTLDNSFMPTYVQNACKALAKDLESKLNDRRGYALEKMTEAMCSTEPFGVSADGYISDLGDISEVTLFSSYNNILKNSVREIYIVGDISQNETESYIKTHFKTHNGKTELPKADYKAEPHQIRYVTEKSKAVQSSVAIGIRTNQNEYAKLLLVNEVIGGSSTSRLFGAIRENRGLCYYISSHLYRYKGIIAIETGIDLRNIDEVLSCIDIQLKRPITAKELKTAKESIITALSAIPDYPARLADFMLSLSIAGDSTLEQTMEDINAVEDLSGIFDKAFIDTVFILEGGNDI